MSYGSFDAEFKRSMNGTKETLKALINKLGGSVSEEKIDEYPNLVDGIEIAGSASDITYDNKDSGLVATDVQSAIDEVYSIQKETIPENIVLHDDSEIGEPFIADADTLEGHPASYFATAENISLLLEDKANIELSNLKNRQLALSNIGGRPNHNLVDNPNFAINQRGFSSINWTAGYGPDRWRSAGGGNLEYSGGSVKTHNQYLLQLYEPGYLTSGTYTISALCTDNIGVELGFWGGGKKSGTSVNYDNGLASITLEITEEMIDQEKKPYIYIMCINSGTISFVKLEKSSIQTLAYKDQNGLWNTFELVDKGEELTKCQRYGVFLGSSELVATPLCVGYAFLSTPVSLRATPVLVGSASVYGIDGNRDYTASASISEMLPNGVIFKITGTTDLAYVAISQGGEVSVRQKAGGSFDMVGQSLLDQLVHQGGSAAALPDDGVIDGGAGGFVPHNGGLPLVGDADGRQVRHMDAALGHHLHHHGILRGPDLHGVVLHPALFGVDLGELFLTYRQDVLLLVKQDGPGTGGSLVQGEDVLCHDAAPFSHIFCGNDVHAGAAYVGDHHLANAHRGSQFHCIQGGGHIKHGVLGHGGIGLDRAAGVCCAGAFYGGGHHPGGVAQLRLAISFALGAAVAGDGIAVFFVHLQMAALGAGNADQFLHLNPPPGWKPSAYLRPCPAAPWAG